MTFGYATYLDLGAAPDAGSEAGDDPPSNRLVLLSRLHLTEGYNMGWRAAGVVAKAGEDPISILNMMAAVLGSGIVPGKAATVHLVIRTEDPESPLDGTVIRTWPVMIGYTTPVRTSNDNIGAAQIELVDPITYLADRIIWGAYRACSIGEMIGGALSMAAGGDGKPSLRPVLPGMPAMTIDMEVREDLDLVPYSIAVGQTLGEWLGTVLGLLGLRLEMLGKSDGSIAVALKDGAPMTTPLQMATGMVADDAPDGKIRINGLSGHQGAVLRGTVLDDPTQGGFRRISGGAVGNVFSGVEISLDEAAKRVRGEIFGSYTEMFVVKTVSSQPGLRPGRLVMLDGLLNGEQIWQLSEVSHQVLDRTYGNNATLLVGNASWHPNIPQRTPPVLVSGVVDAGDEFMYAEPVPRDRLGRIPIRFPFTPLPSGEDLAVLATADTNLDSKVTLADYTAEDVEHFEKTTEREAELAEYRSGAYDDPWPDLDDDDLTPSQLAEREAWAAKRENVLRYLGYKQAKELGAQDKDADGFLSDLDQHVSDELAEALKDPAKKAELERQWALYQEGKLIHVNEARSRYLNADPNDDDWEESVSMEQFALIQEYGRLFGEDTSDDDSDDDAATDPDPDDQALEDARRDAELEPQRWPPRLPLTIIQPMAGTLHGFIPSHRQGDACRIAVHDPLWAEIIGFLYRDDRPLNAAIAGASAGIVVEHDTNDAWSGMVFRRVGDEEEAKADPDPGDDGGEYEDEDEDGDGDGDDS